MKMHIVTVFNLTRQGVWRAHAEERSPCARRRKNESRLNSLPTAVSEATEAKGSGVDNRAGEASPKAAESQSQKRREGEGTPAPPEQAGVSSSQAGSSDSAVTECRFNLAENKPPCFLTLFTEVRGWVRRGLNSE